MTHARFNADPDTILTRLAPFEFPQPGNTETKMTDVVLVAPEIPQNTGNIGRTCVATGSKLWLVRPFGFDLSDKQLRRAGLDYWQHLDYEVIDSLDQMLQRFEHRRMWFFSKKATRIYTDVQYQSDDVLVFGRETLGLPESLLNERRDSALRIPIAAEARCLNLATAVAICAYEVLRQVGANFESVSSNS